jgi:AP-1 complex subunit gamma-1
MKLISSPHFPEKRIGYLGMMLLLSEEAEVLMLSTNGLKNDLNSENKFVSGLALCAIGNLATADMSRDLAPEVDKHLKSSQPYLRKKACLAMARCLTKCPDMVEDFVDRVVTLLKDRSHGVLITVIQLMTQVLIVEQKNNEMEAEYEDDEESDYGTPCQDAFVKLVPSLVKLLRNVTGGGYAANDAGGASDLFLQVQILRLLRLLGTGNEKASEEMNDVLATVATNTETSKNSGNAILYECVQTIMAVESDDGLRVLAVNILGRFLLNRDNNIRYVALNTLSNCIVEAKRSVRDDLTQTATEGVNSAAAALQKHRTTIVDCLKDPDISIRTRALELIYHLVNKENVESLTAELLNYLVLCPREHRADICGRILRVVDKFSPNDRWRVDTLITMLTIAGRESPRNVQSSSIIYISRSSEDLRSYATHKLLKAIRDDDGTQIGLLVVGIWCIGEYGDLLLKPYSYTPPSDVTDVTGGNIVSISFTAIDPASVVNTVEEVVTRHTCPEKVKERAITCFTKLSERYANSGDSDTIERLHKHVKKHSKSHTLELQLRSCEFDALISAMKGVSTNSGAENDIFGVSEGGVGQGVIAAAKEALARMPVVDIDVMQRKRTSGFTSNGGDDDISVGEPQESAPAAAAGGDDLLDLADIFGGTAAPQPTEPTKSLDIPSALNGSAAAPAPAPASDIDLLSDIFSAPAPTPTPAAPAPAMNGGYVDPFSVVSNGNGHSQPAVVPLDVFAPAPTSAPVAPPTAAPIDIFAAAPASAPTPEKQSVTVHGVSHGGLTIDFECSKPEAFNKQNSVLVATFKNTTNAPIYGLSLQCAVPKYVTMDMKPPTSTTIPAGTSNSEVTQTIAVTNKKLGEKNLMLKLKLGFTLNGAKVDHMTTVNSFPPGEY